MPPFSTCLKKYKNRIILSFCLLISCHASIWAQNEARSPLDQRFGNFIFDNMEWGDGISNPFIPSIYQDKQGFIWISTKEGLVRYDGLALKTYTHNPLDSQSLSNHFTWHVTEDHEGILWIPTHGGGLNRFDPIKEHFSVFPIGGEEGLSAGVIWTVREDSQQRLWVGTRGEGLFIINDDRDSPAQFQHNPADPQSLSDNAIGRCLEDHKGRFWVPAERGGLNLFDPTTGKSQRFTYQGGSNKGLASDAFVYDIAEDTSGNLWVPSFRGLSLLDMQDTTFEHYFLDDLSNSLSNNEIWHLTVDAQNRVWLPTRNGLNMLDPENGQFVHFFNDPLNRHSILHDFAFTTYKDREGIIWVGTANGVSKLNPPNFQFISLVTTLEEKKNSNFEGGFRELFVDRRGNIRASPSHTGPFIYNPETNSYRHVSSDTKTRYFYFPEKEDKNGRIWLKKDHQLYYQYLEKEGQWSVCPQAPLLCRAMPDVSTIAVDSTGYLWAGNGSELFKIDSESLELKKRYTIPEEFGKPMLVSIRVIKVDQFQNLWLGGEGGGLYHFNTRKETFSAFDSTLDIPQILDPSLGVNGFILDSKGLLWIYTKDRLMQFTLTREGQVSKIAEWPTDGGRFHEDKLGRYWLVTNEDVTAFDPERGRQRTYSLKGITERLDRTLVSTENGDVYLGGFQGLYRFNPDEFKINALPPPVVLTDFKLSGRSLPVRGTYGDTLARSSPLDTAIRFDQFIKLRHDQNNFSIHFAALSFIQPKLNQYKYLLEGYPQDTLSTTAELPLATYTNLSPGRYTFRVWASNSDGYWNKTGTALKIRIFPPWYWAWWSKALYLLAAFSLIYAFYQFQLKRRLAQAEADRLRELDTAKSRLYTNITHEFRTPLTIILGIAEQLKAQVSEHAKASLQLINRNGRQLLQLVNEMLDLSRLESGQLTLHPELGDVISYLRYLLESFHSYADDKNIRLHFMSDLREFQMDYDAKQLMHVVGNLLSNAIKFSPEGKNVYLFVDAVPAGLSGGLAGDTKQLHRQEQLHITVKDSGIGIPEEKIPHIFDRFYQLDDSTTRSGKGTGIGLTLTHELVTLMGGRIEVKSELGVGSSFTVIIPVSRVHPVRAEPNPPLTPLVAGTVPKTKMAGNTSPQPKPRMLIVEDNPDLVKYLIDTFNPTYNLEVAYNGQQGLEKAIDLVPDIIISDIMMPEKDGFELCGDLKSNRLTSHIPVIMLTARVDTDSRLTGLRRGADAYLEKPFLPEELQTRIKALLEQRKRLQTYYLTQAGLSAAGGTEQPERAEAVVENSFLASVNELIEQHLSEASFKVEQLARSLFIDPSNLYRKITALTGLSPSEYIRSFRMTKAKKLLLETDFSIAVVAGECGFANQNYFSKLFKRETGLSPTAFRAQHR